MWQHTAPFSVPRGWSSLVCGQSYSGHGRYKSTTKCAWSRGTTADSNTNGKSRVICKFVKGRDVFVCLPTGSGKFICFTVLPLVFDTLQGKKGSICLVVSPLMKAQVDAFQGRGLSAAFCGSHQEDQETLDRIRAGCYQLVYITPEALVNNTVYRNMLLESVWQDNLIAYVIYESHCIKTWWVA